MPNDRRALCVGINKFKNYPGSNLNGCVNDANDMAKLLQDHFGFAAGDIKLLVDAAATKAAVIKELNALIAAAQTGTVKKIVFSFSSHGTQVPDTSGDEPDRADEAFCTHDLAEKNGAWDPDHVLVDDELRDLFEQLPSAVELEVFLDTCHSGSGLRGVDFLLDRKPRYMPPPSMKAFEAVADLRSHGLARAFHEKGLLRHILWSGCRADQTSADAHIGGAWHGAFTYYFAQEARVAKGALSRTKLMEKVRKNLKTGKYTQVPQLECDTRKRRAKLG